MRGEANGTGSAEDEMETESSERKEYLNRRDCLKLGATAVAVATGTAVSGTASAATSRRGIAFDRVLDAVDDLGLDDSGEHAIDSTVLENARDGTLIEFPDGTYKIGNSIRDRDVSNFGLVAAEGATPTLVPASPATDLPAEELLIQFEGSNLLFEGFELDFTQGSDYGGRIQVVAESGDVGVYDVTTKGQIPGSVDGYRVEARSSDGVATVENVNMRDGAVEGYSATGIFVGPPHAGEIHIRDCDIWHFPSKGIYASNPAHPDVGEGGTVHVEGGVYKNNNDCDVRVGSAGSTVRNLVSIKEDTVKGETVTWEDPIPRRHWHGGQENIVQTRSIRLKYGRDVLVENCEFVHEIGEGAGVITGAGSHDGGTTIRDCRISVDGADIYPILLKDGDGDGYTVENVSITGTGGRGAGIRIEGGCDGTTVENCCLQLSQSGENGVEVYDSDDCVVADSNIDVEGEAVVFDNVSGETTGLTYSEGCPLPDSDRVSTDDGSTEKTLSNTCTVRSTGEAVDYTVTVTDGIVDGSQGNVVDASVSDTVSGTVDADGESWFWFGGEVDAVDFSADVAFFVNGTEVDPSQYADAGDGSDDTSDGSDGTSDDTSDGSDDSSDGSTEKTLSNTCTVRSTGEAVDYTVTVTDGIVDGSQGNVVDASVSDTVSGTVDADGESWFWFGGEVDAVDFSADVAFFVNGTEVDPSQYADAGDGSGDTSDGSDGTSDDTSDGSAGDSLPNVVSVDGSTSNEVANYVFEVSGDVERDDAASTSTEETREWDTLEDEVTSGKVVGVVYEGVDVYRFSGTLTRLKVDGTAKVTFE
jgi:hypothetical protein